MDHPHGVIRKTYRDKIYEIRLSESGEIVSCYETTPNSNTWVIRTFPQLPLTIQLETINELSRKSRVKFPSNDND